MLPHIFSFFQLLGSCFLIEFLFLEEKLLVLLRDGRKLLGILRSFDQFGTNFLICCLTNMHADFSAKLTEKY